MLVCDLLILLNLDMKEININIKPENETSTKKLTHAATPHTLIHFCSTYSYADDILVQNSKKVFQIC